MNDIPQTRTVQDLERKYNLGNINTQIEEQKKEMQKVDSELNSFVQSIQIQIDGKSETWYNNGVPSLNNYPTNEWEELETHVKDMYYDKLTGKSYIFQHNNDVYEWKLIEDESISQALAIAGSAQDTADGKRRVFTIQPSPPYDNGDLWVGGSSGDIKVCQISKESGSFSQDDWIIASKYTDNTVANAIVTELGGLQTTVLNGQVVTISNSFAKYTDLATGGSTTIAGENVTTGNLKSSNYVQNQSGSKLNLATGEFDSPNVKINQQGMILKNGAKIVGDDGLISTNLIESADTLCGIIYSFEGIYKQGVILTVIIPTNYVVTNAKIRMYHTPAKWSIYGQNPVWGYARNVRLYKATNLGNRLINGSLNGGYDINSNVSYTEIRGAFGSNGFTASVPSDSSHNLQYVNSTNIANVFGEAGIYQLKLETSNPISGVQNESSSASTMSFISALLQIDGYIKY